MRDSRGFTLLELLIVVAILGIVAAVGVASYRGARLQANEGSALATLSAINQAQFAFAQTCGHQTFAPALPALGVVPPGARDAYLSPDLTGAELVVKSGYRFAMEGEPADPPVETCTGVSGTSGYRVTADPVTPGISGSRFFGTNTDRIIFEDSEAFGEAMPERGDPVRGREAR